MATRIEIVDAREYGVDFFRVGNLLAQAPVGEMDNRPCGNEQEGQLRITGPIAADVLLLIVRPREMEDGTIAAKPISFRDATRAEERHYWRWHG